MATLFIIGRILLGGFFIYNAVRHFTNISGMAAYAGSKKIPLPKAAVIVSGIMLAIAGLSILTGFYIVLGMWLAGLFLLVTLFTMHAFWKETDPHMRAMQVTQFSKNTAILGALLMLSAILALVG